MPNTSLAKGAGAEDHGDPASCYVAVTHLEACALSSTQQDHWSGPIVLEDVRHVFEADSARRSSFESAEQKDGSPRRLFGFISLRRKLITLVVAAGLVPMIASAIFIYQSALANSQQHAEQYAADLVTTLATSADRLLDDVGRFTFLPVTDRNLLAVLQAHSGNEHTPTAQSERAAVTAAFLPARFETESISNLRLFLIDGTYFELNQQNLYEAKKWSPALEDEWMEKASAADGALVFVSDASQDTSWATQGSISLARLVREPITHRPLGFVVVDAAHGVTDKLIVPTLETSTIELLDSQSLTVFSASSGTAAEPLREDESLIVSSAVAPSGLFTIVGSFSASSFENDALALTRAWMLFSGVALLLAIFAASIMARRLTNPIASLRDTMTRVASGAITERADISSRDEVGQLAKSLNSMLDEIDTLVSRLESMAVREREAVTWALLGQMNPHYLFNSLELVNMAAAKRNQWEISDAIGRVGRQFRYLIDVSTTTVPLSDEVDFVSNWADVYSSNPEAAVELVLEVDQQHTELQLPRFVLQPLVENAMIHGSGRSRRVVITSRQQGETVIISVHNETDDDPETSTTIANDINARIQCKDLAPTETRTREGVRSHGLNNVHRRLQLAFGERFGVRASSCSGIFTVEARIPLNPGSER